jgi:hypothetical protein
LFEYSSLEMSRLTPLQSFQSLSMIFHLVMTDRNGVDMRRIVRDLGKSAQLKALTLTPSHS